MQRLGLGLLRIEETKERIEETKERAVRMGRYRSRSYSPVRRKRYDEPRERHSSRRSVRDRRSPGPTGLLVRNISLNSRFVSYLLLFHRSLCALYLYYFELIKLYTHIVLFPIYMESYTELNLDVFIKLLPECLSC